MIKLLKIIILDSKSCFLFITFTNFYLIINISKIKFNKSFNLIKAIKIFS